VGDGNGSLVVQYASDVDTHINH